MVVVCFITITKASCSSLHLSKENGDDTCNELRINTTIIPAANPKKKKATSNDGQQEYYKSKSFNSNKSKQHKSNDIQLKKYKYNHS